MANSSIINSAKNKIIKEIIKDDLIVQVIDSPDITSPEKLINSHIFNFHQNPETLQKVITFITVQVHIPDSVLRNHTYVQPQVEIWIISHVDHMTVNNIPKITSNRNDYLSELLDEKLNGRADFGIGKLMLTCNIEGAYQKNYLYRKMLFETTDLNTSLCEME